MTPITSTKISPIYTHPAYVYTAKRGGDSGLFDRLFPMDNCRIRQAHVRHLLNSSWEATDEVYQIDPDKPVVFYRRAEQRKTFNPIELIMIILPDGTYIKKILRDASIPFHFDEIWTVNNQLVDSNEIADEIKRLTHLPRRF